MTQQTMTNIEASTEAASRAAQQAQSTQNRGLMAGGLLAGGGVAFAAVGAGLSYVGKTLAENPWGVIGGLGAAVLAVLVPTLVQAFLTLRRRDLSAVLEGSGWAINARMRLSLPQSHRFTQRPPYPSGALGLPGRASSWWVWVIAIVVVAVLAWGAQRIVGSLQSEEPEPPAPAEQVDAPADANAPPPEADSPSKP